jgi:hypothetical protein
VANDKNRVVLFGVGDVGPIHDPIEPFSALVRDTLAEGDLRFAQCERIYSLRGELQAHRASNHSHTDPSHASVISDCKFDVVSVASNHGMDFGVDALLETMDVVRSRGAIPIGAGKTLQESVKPAFFERNGVRIAFLAYCTVLPEGYEARANRAGIAPLRAHTYYEPYESQPGMPPKVVTIAYEDDVQAMIGHIKAAKKEAHCVVVSHHWGLHQIPRMIADYQPVVARACFAAGADLILGHHSHLPKGIEVFDDGKACFYGLSNFIMSLDEMTPHKAANFMKRYGAYGATVNPDPAYARLAYGYDGKRSMIAKAILTKEGVKKVSFLPVLIDRELRPEILLNGDERFDEMVKYMDWCSEGLNHRFTVEGDEVIVTG